MTIIFDDLIGISSIDEYAIRKNLSEEEAISVLVKEALQIEPRACTTYVTYFYDNGYKDVLTKMLENIPFMVKFEEIKDGHQFLINAYGVLIAISIILVNLYLSCKVLKLRWFSKYVSYILLIQFAGDVLFTGFMNLMVSISLCYYNTWYVNSKIAPEPIVFLYWVCESLRNPINVITTLFVHIYLAVDRYLWLFWDSKISNNKRDECLAIPTTLLIVFSIGTSFFSDMSFAFLRYYAYSGKEIPQWVLAYRLKAENWNFFKSHFFLVYSVTVVICVVSYGSIALKFRKINIHSKVSSIVKLFALSTIAMTICWFPMAMAFAKPIDCSVALIWKATSKTWYVLDRYKQEMFITFSLLNPIIFIIIINPLHQPILNLFSMFSKDHEPHKVEMQTVEEL